MKNLRKTALLVVIFLIIFGCNNQNSNPIGFKENEANRISVKIPEFQITNEKPFLFECLFSPLETRREQPNIVNYGACSLSYIEDSNQMFYTCSVFDLNIVEDVCIYQKNEEGEYELIVKLYPTKKEISGNTFIGIITDNNLIGPLAKHRLKDLVKSMLNRSTFIIVNTDDFLGKFGGLIIAS